MDDLLRTGLFVIALFCIAAAIVLYGIASLVVMELHALAAGDTGFLLASAAGVLLFCGGYIGTGLWLRRMGRI